MDITIIKGQADDRLVITRADGSVVETRFPKKGPVPHDAVHVIVEETLGLKRGFWGMIASGNHPDAVQEIAKAAGHASAKRAAVPEAHIVELLQAERIVEAAEAALWSGGTDREGMRHLAEAGCIASHVPVPDLSDDRLDAILAQVRDLATQWGPASIGYELRLSWLGGQQGAAA